MNKSLGLICLIAGIVLLIFGINASDSLGSDISRFFTGAPTDKSIWLLLGGIAATTAGATSVLRGNKV